MSIAVLGYDITDRMQLEEEHRQIQVQLQQAQKMESLGLLAGGIAHDMNNVLGSILGMATANLQLQTVSGPTHRAFDIIARAATRGGEMAKSLLAFARQSPVEQHQLDLNELIKENVRLLEHSTLSRISLEMDLTESLPPVLGDANALTHALMNLCVNAVDAMPDGGTLTLQTLKVDDHWVEVRVQDTGSGMPKEIMEKAIDPFYTTKPLGKGTGLGLSMAYKTVQAHHGQLTLQSQLGHGTIVKILLPSTNPIAKVDPGDSEESHSTQRTLIVLLVDDDSLIQSTMQEILGMLGHAVSAVLSGEDALERLESGFKPDVIILDMNMPGLGGVGTLPRIRQLNRTVPILLATGRADDTALNLMSAHSNVTLLSKPFSAGELRDRLEQIGSD